MSKGTPENSYCVRIRRFRHIDKWAKSQVSPKPQDIFIRVPKYPFLYVFKWRIWEQSGKP